MKEEIQLKEIPEGLVKQPHRFICDYYESIYPNIGRRVFDILCLVPVSLLIPRIPCRKKQVKSKINFLLISNPGSGKTSLAEEFEKITYEPLPMEYITDARLFYELSGKERVSIIISDIFRIFSNPILTKQLENVLGEDACISRSTMHTKEEDTKQDIDAVAYLSGTPEIISHKIIRDGIIARTSPLIVYYSEKEHEEILNYVNEGIGIEDNKNIFNYIRLFYDDLEKIQNGTHPKINPIKGYVISEKIKEDIIKFIKPLVKPIFEKYGITCVRELEQTYRFMVSNSFLNINPKKIKNDKIVIDEGDVKIAKKLIRREIYMKNIIFASIDAINRNNIRTRNELRNYWEKYKIKENKEVIKEARFIMGGLVK